MIAVAAAVVIVLGAAIVLLSRSNEESPVATDPPVTTVVVPSTEPEAVEELDPQLEEALAVATAFTDASAAGDLESLESLVLLDGHTLSILGMVGVELADTEAAWRNAVGWTITIDGCSLSNPDVENTSIVCESTHTNALSEALGVGPYWSRQHLKVLYDGDSKLSTPIEKTIISEGLTVEFPTATFSAETGEQFSAWLEANHPNDVEAMLSFDVNPDLPGIWFGDGVPNLTDESIQLWQQRVAEFVAEQTG